MKPIVCQPQPLILWVTVLLTLFLVLSNVTSLAAQNLLTNPGFESPYNAVYQGSPGVVSGVVANGWADNSTWISGSTVVYSQDTSVYYSGSSSQKCVVSTGYAEYQQTPTFQAGRYTASIYIKALAPTWVSLALEESGGSYTNYAVACLRASTTWQQISVTGITPATPGKVLLTIAEPGTVWLDSASLVYQGVNPTPVSLTPPTSSIPSTYFGLHPQDLAPLGYGPLAWPSVGFGYARSHDCAPTWAQTETSNGTYNWVNLDNFVNSARASGQKVLYTFSETPQWATTDTNVDAYGYVGGNGVPSNISYWTSFVTAVVNRYKGEISAYEIWNEPNTEFWDGTATQMAQMETTAAPIIHSTDSSALVTCAAYSINNSPQNLVDCEQYFAAGGGSDSDVLAFHLYDSTPEDDIPCINAIKSLAAAYGYSSKPIWNTETGWGDSGQTTGWDPQPMASTAAFVPRSYVLDWVMGITNFDWYAWNDAGNVGVSENSGDDWTVLTPGAVSYQQVESWLNGVTVTSCALDGNGNWVAKTSSSSGITGWIVWNNDASYNYPVPSGATTEYDTAGDVISLSGVSAVTVGGTPIYITNGPAPPAPVTTTVNLSNYYNTIGITNDSAPTLGNLDGSGYSYSAQAIGSESLDIGGVPFTLGPFTNSTNNVVSSLGQTIILPPGKYSTLYLLGCGVQYDQTNLPFTVYYSNGTASNYTVSMSNWGANDESNIIAMTTSYRNGPSGQQAAAMNIFEYPLTLNNNATAVSLCLPPQTQAKILAVTLVPAAALPGTTTTVSSSLNPSTSGNTVTFTAAVTGASPTGTVQFAIDGSSAGSPVTLSSSHATYATSSLSVGTHTVTATYSGDTNNAGSSGTLSPSQVVNAAGAGVPVSLSSYYNCIGITNNSAPTLGNIDGSGYSYSAQSIGSQSLTIGGVPFTLGPFTNSTNNVITATGQTIPLPSGTNGTLYLLGCGVQTDQLSQSFTVNYTSGSPTTGSFNMSNWGANDEGNTVAQAMTSRNGPGGTVSFDVDIYEYAITLNSSSTVSSLQLPSNSEVKILAATLVPSGGLTSTTTTVSSSLNPSTYGTSVTFTVTVTGSSPTGTVQFAIDGSNVGSPVTLSSGSATYATSTLAVGTHTVTATYSGDANHSGSTGTLSPSQVVNTTGSTVTVSLSSYFNTIGITNDTATTYGNIDDGGGYSYSAEAIGSQSLTVGSIPFSLGSFVNDTNNVVTCASESITLPSGKYSTLYLLGCGTNGSQQNTFTVNYTSGSPATFNLTLNDWCASGGNTVAKTMTYRNGQSGQSTITNDIYEYVLTLSNTSTVASLQLPTNPNVKILAATLAP